MFGSSPPPFEEKVSCLPIHSPAGKGSTELAVVCGQRNSPAWRDRVSRRDQAAITWFQQAPAWGEWRRLNQNPSWLPDSPCGKAFPARLADSFIFNTMHFPRLSFSNTGRTGIPHHPCSASPCSPFATQSLEARVRASLQSHSQGDVSV